MMTNARETTQRKAVDAWIASELLRRYEAIIAEPLPSEWLALLAN